MSEQLVAIEIELDELNRKSRLLNILTWSLSFALGAFLIVVLVLRLPSMIASLVPIISALAVCGVAYWLNRFGKFSLAAYIFLGGFIMVANTSTLLPDIPLETRIVGPLFYSLSVVAAGVLVAPAAAFWFAGFGAATLLIIAAFLGGGASFSASGDVALGWGVISAPIIFAFVLASLSWLFGNNINTAFTRLGQRSEELQASEEELRAANEELQSSEEELRASNEELGAANEELRESQEQLVRSQQAIDAMIDGVTITDMRGRLTDFNRAAVEQFGYEKEEAVGKTPQELFIVEKEFPRFFKALEELLSGKHLEASDYLVKRKDGEEFSVNISLSVIRDTEGKPSEIVAVTRDITERKRMEQEIQDKNEQLDAQNEELQSSEEELRASNEELEAANEELREAQEQLVRSERLAAIGQLAGGVGHELRNPLGAIKNAVYYIKGKLTNTELAQKEPRVTEFLDIVDEEINSSNKIINDLLGFSRVGKPATSPARIEHVIDDSLSYITIPDNVELERKLDSSLPEIEIDTDQIRQVLTNIVTNAVQAMPEGGKLTIETRQKDSLLEIDISDTGIGIPDKTIGKIFDPLFTTRAKGIGLGLAVCKTVISRHEGEIEVRSEEGKGTTFTIKLPLKAKQSSSNSGGK